jgi:hypothetical protein
MDIIMTRLGGISETPASLHDLNTVNSVNRQVHKSVGIVCQSALSINRTGSVPGKVEQDVHSQDQNNIVLQSRDLDDLIDNVNNESADDMTLVQSRKRRRVKNSSDSPELITEQSKINVNSSAILHHQSNSRSSGPKRIIKTFIGKSAECSDLKASKPILEKSFFYIGNIEKHSSQRKVQKFVLEKFGIHCLSCYPIIPRNTDSQTEDEEENIEYKAFRVCIKTIDVRNFTNMNLWPKSVLLRKWIFNEKRS